MARIRQFKPSFFTDDKVGRLSRDARLFFFGVLSEADDEGRLVDSAKRLAGVVFPFDDDVTPKKVERWISELEGQRMVIRYQHEGGRFLYVRKFKDHQRMSHPTPSSLPPPPPEPEHSSGDPPEKLRSGAGEPPEDFVPEVEGLFEGVFVYEGVPSGSSSSINHQSAADESAEEEDQPGVATPEHVARLVAERRWSKLSDPPPEGFRKDAWLIATAASVLADGGAEDIRDLLAKGRPVPDIVDLYEPPPKPDRTPEAAYHSPTREQPPPAWDLDDNGFAVERRVSA